MIGFSINFINSGCDVGKVKILLEDSKEVHFTLSNKPFVKCLIDREDFDRFVRGTKCWYVHKTNREGCDYYIRMNCPEEKIQKHLHRELLGLGRFSPACVVDHDNHCGVDNRRFNLIECDQRKNAQNMRSGINNVVYRGVSISQVRRQRKGWVRITWQAYFFKEGNSTYIANHRDIDKVKKKIDEFLN